MESGIILCFLSARYEQYKKMKVLNYLQKALEVKHSGLVIEDNINSKQPTSNPWRLGVLAVSSFVSWRLNTPKPEKSTIFHINNRSSFIHEHT